MGQFDRQSVRRIVQSVLTTEGMMFTQKQPWDNRRVFDDGGGDSAQAFAIVKGTVPAASGIDTSGADITTTQVITPGKLAGSGDETSFSSGALLVDSEGYPIVENGKIVVKNAVNMSYTRFVGRDEGVAVIGTVQDLDFIIGWPDNRALLGHLTGTAPVGGDDPNMQLVYHAGGTDEYTATDTLDCEPPT